jgi:hypothetical protein
MFDAPARAELAMHIPRDLDSPTFSSCVTYLNGFRVLVVIVILCIPCLTSAIGFCVALITTPSSSGFHLTPPVLPVLVGFRRLSTAAEKDLENELIHKLWTGGSFNLRKITNRDQYAIDVLRHTLYIYVPTWTDLDHKRCATVNAELADRGSEHTATKIFAQIDTVSETARRLAISISVFKKNGSRT